VRESKIKGPYYIPYRSPVPQKVEGLLLAGRCISATQKAMASLRIMPVCSQIGQAAGVAAAQCAKSGVQPRNADASLIRRELRAQGVLLHTASGK
jgi:hypothetical protein